MTSSKSYLTDAKRRFDDNVTKIVGATFIAVLIFFAFDSLMQYIFQDDRRIPESAYFLAVSFMLFLILEHIVRIERFRARVRIFENDPHALNSISSHLKSENIKRVDCLEYSGNTIGNLIRELMNKDCKIRLLLFDPRQTEDKDQRDRIKSSYKEKTFEFTQAGKKGNLEIGFYATPASVRGRKFDDIFVSIGWLVFFKDDMNKTVVFGHDRPMINAKTSTETGQVLSRFFDEQFKKLWENRILPKELEAWWKEGN